MLLDPRAPPEFPDPRDSDAEGLVAVGGDLSPKRLLAAYGRGIFPWYDSGLPQLWWSPDPRAILDVAHLHVSRSLRRVLRHDEFTLSYDRAFTDVMHACADRPEGTWILPEMIDAYTRLFKLGHAHSFEVWHAGALAGGLYGVHVGGLFAAESMFHRRTNASKVALVSAVTTLFYAGIELIDVQFVTPHLATMGAHAIPRGEYLDRVAAVRSKRVSLRDLEPRVPE